MQKSQDVNSASIGGMIQPIRHHVGDPGIEREVFALEPNQISPIIPVADQFAILKCEGKLPPREVPLESVRDELVERIKEEKLRDVAGNLFEQLQNSATIQNVWNDPQLRQQMPGVVATVNGEPIRYTELAEECLLRHGEQVLEVEISHLLLQQALAKQNVAVTQQDLDDEIAHAAKLAGVVDAQGKPDFDKWFKMATEEQGLKKEQYLRDSVWPSAALKKLTGGSIQVTNDDLAKELRRQLRRAGPLPGDRAGRHAAGAGSVGQGPRRIRRWISSATWRSSIRSSRSRRRCAARCRRSAATAGSRSSKTWPSRWPPTSSRASSSWATSS